jgi:biopolymer transport protein ExbD
MALRGFDVSTEDDGVLSSINVIPFVDIVLVLLVIFMVTSATIMRASLKVDLPKAASAGGAVPSTINLTVTSDGALLLNGEASTPEGAAAAVRASVAQDPKTQAVIAADKGVAYGRVIDLIDLVKLGGITSFALDVERIVPGEPAP